MCYDVQLKRNLTDHEDVSRSKLIALLLKCMLSSKRTCLFGISLLKRLFVKQNQTKISQLPLDLISPVYLQWVMGTPGGFCILMTSWRKARLWPQINQQKCVVRPAWRCWWKQNIGFIPGRVSGLSDQFLLQINSHLLSVWQLITRHLRATFNKKCRISANVFFSKPSFIYSFDRYILGHLYCARQSSRC